VVAAVAVPVTVIVTPDEVSPLTVPEMLWGTGIAAATKLFDIESRLTNV